MTHSDAYYLSRSSKVIGAALIESSCAILYRPRPQYVGLVNLSGTVLDVRLQKLAISLPKLDLMPSLGNLEIPNELCLAENEDDVAIRW